MSHGPSAAEYVGALSQRLHAVAPSLVPGFSPTETGSAAVASRLLDVLVRAVHNEPRIDRLWLLHTGVTATLPTIEELQAGMHLLRLYPPDETMLWLLDQARDCAADQEALMPLRLSTDRVLVDVSQSACNDLHTGIQQVVRKTLPLWDQNHPIEPVAWTSSRGCPRELRASEAHRVLKWGVECPPTHSADQSGVLVVPWRTVAVLIETPPPEACERLAAMAAFSGNRVVAVGYDCIPAISADLVAPAEPDRFTSYLSVIKHARRVAAISESAQVEFSGLIDTLEAQGLRGPSVKECPLPTAAAPDVDSTDLENAAALGYGDVPLIISVGTFEPRKNHLSLLYAAERLWREGHRFRLSLIAGGAWDTEILQMVAHLRSVGRPVDTRIGISDAELVAAYRRATFTVFTSLHEGFGLPVAESLSLGTPVITSGYGSMREIGSGGGALLIDPRDDDALVAAMGRLLVDDTALEELRVQAASRGVRTWAQYATRLWKEIVEPELAELSAETKP